MPHPENNEKNRFEVATKVVSTWDVEDLRQIAVHGLIDDYQKDEEFFAEEFDNFRDSFEWSQELRESMKKDCPNPGCCCGACERD